MLKDFYEEAEGLEIVFVSGDQNSAAMFSYMKESHGDWLAVEHGSQLSDDLNKKFDVEGIPTLVVVKADGTVVNKDAVGDVYEKSAEDAVKSWKS